MTTTRKTIRVNTAAALVAAGLSVGSRVFTNRVDAWAEKELPAISVYTGGEDVERESEGHYLRKVSLVIEIVAEGLELIDDVLDLLAEGVEGAMWVDESLGGCASDLELLRIEGPELEADGRQVIGSMRVVFEASYHHEIERPIPTTPFEGADVKIDTDRTNVDPEAQDKIELPQS